MFRSLRWKISLSYVSLLVVALAALGLYLLFTLERLQLTRLQDDLGAAAFLTETAIGPLLADGDPASLRLLLAESGRRSATRILVTDAQGRLLGSTEQDDQEDLGQVVTLPGIQEALRGESRQGLELGGVDHEREIVYDAQPVYRDGRLVGVIRLAYQYNDVEQVIHTLYATVGSGIVGTGILALGVGLALANTVTRPLERLRQATIALAAEGRTPRLPPARDEIGDLTKAFNRMAARLEELEAMRRDFLADVSHEIHTLASAMGMASEALAQGARERPATYARLVGGLSDHVDRLNRLADDLVQLSRLERGALDLHDQPLRLDAVAEQVGAQFMAEAERRGIELVVESGERLPVTGDPIRLGQVAANLLSNALKFTPRGGRVRIRSAAESDAAVLEVSDTGIGIAPADLPRVFDRYYRAGGDHERARTGMGLGLAIAQGIARAEGGRIEAESAPGAGSRFRLILPLQSAALPIGGAVRLGG
jgi:two-component system sensor histidine kinase BaeS